MGAIPRRLRSRLRTVSAAYAIFERDFLVFTSQRRFLVLRTLAVFVPVLVVGVIVAGNLGSPPDSVGWEVFAGAFTTVPCLVMLLAPAVAAPAIAGERKLRTLDIVLVAPVGPWSFVFAKFLSRLGTVLVLILGTLPISALCLVYGGISFTLFLDAVALCVAFAVWGVAMGIFASAFSRSVAPAVLLAYALTVLAPGIYSFALGLLGFLDVTQPGGLAATAAAFSGFLTWTGVLAGSFSGNAIFGGPGAAHLLAASAVAIPALLLAGARIRSEAAWTSRAPRAGRRRRRFSTGFPVLDLGLRGSPLSRPGWGAAGLLAAVLAVEGLAMWLGAEIEDLEAAWPHLVGMQLAGGIVCFAVLARAAAGIAGERRQGSLALLLTTPLGAARIVAGQIVSTLVAVAPLLAIPVAHAAVALAYTDLEPAAALSWLVATAVVLFLFAALGVRISIAARSAGRAVLAVFGVVLGGIVAHGVLMLLVSLVADDADGVGRFMACASPPVVVVALPILVTIYAGSGVSSAVDRELFASCVFWLVAYGVLATLLVVSSCVSLRRSGE